MSCCLASTTLMKIVECAFMRYVLSSFTNEFYQVGKMLKICQNWNIDLANIGIALRKEKSSKS